MDSMQAAPLGVGNAPRPVGPDDELRSELHQRAESAANTAFDLEQQAASWRRYEHACRAGLEQLQVAPQENTSAVMPR